MGWLAPDCIALPRGSLTAACVSRGFRARRSARPATPEDVNMPKWPTCFSSYLLVFSRASEKETGESVCVPVCMRVRARDARVCV